MTEIKEQTNLNWLQEENKTLQQNIPTQYEKLPSLKLEENKVTELTIDFSKPFEKWTGDQSGKSKTKAIIPVTENNERKIFWLNVRNPVYREIIKLGAEGKNTLKIMATGTQQNTKYILVK